MNEIIFGTRRISYNLHRQDRKRMRIIVAPEHTVDVFAPITADENEIQAAVMKKVA
jgi:predicted metal-dependent hydrolase